MMTTKQRSKASDELLREKMNERVTFDQTCDERVKCVDPGPAPNTSYVRVNM